MTEVAMGNLLAIFSSIMIIVNYVVTSIAMFKISKKESISKAFFAWIPILNDYLLIKLGQGSVCFLVLALLSLILGSPMTGSYFNSTIMIQAGVAATALWALYKILLYSRICDRYDANIIILAAGFLMQIVSRLSVAGLIVTIVGQVLLMKKVKNGVAPKTIIESKIVMSRRHKKEKEK